jgi:hypothetical protein
MGALSSVTGIDSSVRHIDCTLGRARQSESYGGSLPTALRVVKRGIGVGAVTFAAGFFGPIVVTPDANQGPLLGIFITGPLGFFAGLVWGAWRELRRPRSGPTQA